MQETEMSSKSLQICHCGWTKETTYHGLRTHQGKHGCTPQGTRIQESNYSMYCINSSSRNSPGKVLASLINIQEPLLDPCTNLTDDPYSGVSIMGHMTQLGMTGNAQTPSALPSINILQRQNLERLQQTHLPGVSSKQENHSVGSTVDEALFQLVRASLPQGRTPPPPMCFLPQQQMTFFETPSSQTFVVTSAQMPATDRTASLHQSVSNIDGRSMVPYAAARQETVGGAAQTPVFKTNTPHSQSDVANMDKRTHEVMMGNPPGNSGLDPNNFANQLFQQTSRSTTEDSRKQQALLLQELHNRLNISEVELPDKEKFLFQTPQGDRQSAHVAEHSRRRLDFSTDQPKVAEQWSNSTAKKPDEAALDEREKDNERTAQKMLKARQDQLRAYLQQETRARQKKLTEVKSSVKDYTEHLAAEWLEIDQVFLEVMKIVEDTWHKALTPLEQRRTDVEKEASVLIQKLSSDIRSFKGLMEEVDQNPSVQVPSLKTMDKSKDWKKLSLNTSSSFGTLRTTTSAMMDQIHQKLENLSTIELKRIPTFAVDVKLDPETAHSCLVVSPDGKTVKDVGNKQEGTDSPQKFSLFGSILGSNRFTTGKCYWEVEVTNKTGWDLGVASAKANRKGKINFQLGYWVIVHYEGDKYAALSDPPTSLSLKSKPEKVGVFVDYEEGLVSFYDVTNQSHIYSYTGCSFTGEIIPYFSPHLRQNGKNSDPLVIFTVKQ